MEQNLHSPEAYDFRQYDRIWQRVAPTLEPYPSQQPPQAVPAMAEQPVPPSQPPAVQPETPPESQLPGAVPNPCCMGTAAAEMLEVLTGFIEEALGDRRYYLAMLRQAPAWARQRLREIADDKAAHARQLMAVHYLITGECYQPAVSCERLYIGRWCPALRERYHAEACSGLNYIRAAEGTTDPCLTRLLEGLSADAYRHADILLALLEREMLKCR